MLRWGRQAGAPSVNRGPRVDARIAGAWFAGRRTGPKDTRPVTRVLNGRASGFVAKSNLADGLLHAKRFAETMFAR